MQFLKKTLFSFLEVVRGWGGCFIRFQQNCTVTDTQQVILAIQNDSLGLAHWVWAYSCNTNSKHSLHPWPFFSLSVKCNNQFSPWITNLLISTNKINLLTRWPPWDAYQVSIAASILLSTSAVEQISSIMTYSRQKYATANDSLTSLWWSDLFSLTLDF